MSLSNVKHLSKFLVLNQKGLLRQDNNLNSDFWTQVRRSESLSQKLVSHLVRSVKIGVLTNHSIQCKVLFRIIFFQEGN